MSIKRIASIAFGVLVLSRHDARAACETSTLPDVTCQSGESACCVDIPQNDSPSVVGDSSRLCDQRHYWDIFSPLLSSNAITQQNELYGISTQTFTDYPAAVSMGGSTWAQYLVATRLLAGVKYVAGVSWHDSVQDYVPAIRGTSSPYHSDHGSKQVSVLSKFQLGDTSSMMHNPGIFDVSELEMSCAHFGFTPVKQAAVVLHESWHQVYGDHDDPTAPTDYFWRRSKGVLSPGEMSDEFPSLYVSDGSTNVALSSQQSVFQTELYYTCDMITTPEDWVSNRSIAQARFLYTELLGNLRVPNGVMVDDLCLGDFCVPGFDCYNATSLHVVDPNSGEPSPNAAPRYVSFTLNGSMLDEAPPLSSDSIVTLSSSASEVMLPASGEWATIAYYTRSTDDTRFDFALEARLLPDRRAVEVRFEGAFYEDPPDCELDTAPSSFENEGSQCIGLGGGHYPSDGAGKDKWASTTLDDSHRVVAGHYDLNNAWNEGDRDHAEFDVEISIDF